MQDYLIALGYLSAASRQARGVTMAIGTVATVTHAIDWSRYVVPAIATPWNGRWHSGSGPRLCQELLGTQDDRLHAMQAGVLEAAAIPSDGRDKAEMVRRLRNESQCLVEWIDACWIIGDDGEVRAVRAAGTGGNWASQDLGVTAIRAAIDFSRGDQSRGYHVTAYGPRDMTATEYLLLCEGLMVMSPSASRRLRCDDYTQPCMSARCVHHTDTDADHTWGSWWLPIWTQPASIGEVRAALGNHDGWTSDVAAARCIRAGQCPAGVQSYARWVISRSGDVIRALDPS